MRQARPPVQHPLNNALSTPHLPHPNSSLACSQLTAKSPVCSTAPALHTTLGPLPTPKSRPSLLGRLPHFQFPSPSSILQSCLGPRLTPLRSLPVTSRTEIPSQPPPSHTSAPPCSALPRPPTSEPRPLPRRLGQGRSLFPPSPAPYRHAQGQPDPKRPRGDPRAEACGRGVAGSRHPLPSVPRPPSLLPPGNVRGG